MKRIQKQIAVALTALLVPGGIPLVAAMWAWERRMAGARPQELLPNADDKVIPGRADD